MNAQKLLLPLLATTIIAGSCGRESASTRYGTPHDGIAAVTESPAADSAASISEESESNASPLGSLSDPARKIIKTADLRCRVTDVYAATIRIEQLAAIVGGGIATSKLENTTDDTRTLPYCTDSLRQISSYTTTAHLSLRIPVQRLDTVLADIAGSATFINNRSLQLDDVTLRYLANKLKNEAMEGNDAATRARTLAHHSVEAVYSGDYTDERNDTRIDRRIENLKLRDDVAYATLTIDLYQPQRLIQSVVPNIEALMQPGIGQRTALALSGGWHLLQSFLLGLLAIWPLLLLIIAGIAGYRRYRRYTRRGPAGMQS